MCHLDGMYSGCAELDVWTAGHTRLCPLLDQEGGVLVSGSCGHPLPLFVAPNIKTACFVFFLI